MSQQVNKSGRWLFGLAILTALAFGARAALASTAESLSCPPDSIGTCVDKPDCQHQCDVLFPPAGSSIGECGTNHCCRCLT